MAATSIDFAELATAARIGIFGGTFDPIHIAHLIIAQEVATRLHLDRILFMPAGEPPHKLGKHITSAQHRQAMVALAIAENPQFALSTLELEHTGPSYTVLTLTRLREQLGPSPLFFLLLGGDMVYDIVNWRNPFGIVQQVAGIAAVQRPGFGFRADELAALDTRVTGLGAAIRPVQMPQIAISSTMIRDRVAQHLPVRYLVPVAVEAYIQRHALYQGSPATTEEDAL